MKYYQIYGLNIESDFILQGVYEITKPEEIDVTICREIVEEKYIKTMPLEDEMALGHGFVRHEKKWTCARFKEIAVFIIVNGNKIGYHLYKGYDPIRVNEILLNYCMSVVAYQRNMIMIHGSGINYNGETLIISGESGAGKSSLADEMLERGYKLMADDVVAIDQDEGNIYAYPAYPMRKLCVDVLERKGIDKNNLIPIKDDEREKYGIILKDEYYPDKAVLGAMVIIRKGSVKNVIVEEVTGGDKLKYLTSNFIRKEIFNKVCDIKESIVKAIKMANNMHIYILTRPDNQITVQQQADIIETVLNKMV